MKAEEDMDERVEPDVEPDYRHPGVPATLNEIAARKGEAVDIIDARVTVLKTLRIESIRRTSPEDWVAYRDDKTGRETAYLQDAGCQRIAPLWGIETRPKGMDRTPEKSASIAEDFAYTVRGDAFCKITSQAIFDVEGTRYSTEKYAEQAAPGIHREVAVKKAARANFDGTCVRKLAGMSNVPVSELLQVWGDDKMKSRIAKGRGYGSQAERQGAEVQQSDEIPSEFQPRCSNCNAVMKFVPAGKSSQGRPYAAFWSCPSREHKFTLKHEQVLAEAKRMQAEAETGSDHTEAV